VSPQTTQIPPSFDFMLFPCREIVKQRAEQP
jgi:hypothetical protein